MSILSFPTAAHARRPAPRPALAGFGALWAGMLQTWRHLKAERAMQGLSDAALHDIGVARSEIGAVVRHGRPARR